MAPTRAQLRTHIKRIVDAAPDLSQLTRRIIKDALVEEDAVDAEEIQEAPYKDWIKELISEAVSEVEQERATGREPPAEDEQARSNDPDASTSSSAKPRASSSTLPPDSDMSSLEDSDGAAPRKRAKGEKAEKRKGKVKKSAKHESELKRLQSYVNACGSRRQWKRLYAAEGISEDDEKAQCALVRRVLDELGMPARCSMKEAKRIREEREFKIEIEAIQDSTLMAQGSARSSRSRTLTRKQAEREQDDSDGDEGVSHSKKKRTAMNDLAAFAAELNSD